MLSLSATPWWRRIVALFFILFISVTAFGQPLFFSVGSTPYDRQMHRVSLALNSGSSKYQVPISLDVVNQWMTQLRAMPYRFSPLWQTPSEVSLMQAADCKGKAVALYAQMRSYGAKNVRVVIGKRHPYDVNTHAWLEWQTSQGNYMLDPTFNERAVRTAELDPLMYVASYAYDGEGKYRASHGGYFASATRVATGTTDRLYVPAQPASSYTQSGFTSFGAPQFYSSTTQPAAPATQYRQAGVQNSWSQTQNPAHYVPRPAMSAAISQPVYSKVVYQSQMYPSGPQTRLTTQAPSASPPSRHLHPRVTSTGSRRRHHRHVVHRHKHSAAPTLLSQS